MNHEQRYNSPQRNYSRHYNHHHFYNHQDRQYRGRSRSRHRSSSNQESMNAHSSSVPGCLSQQQRNNVQHGTHQHSESLISNPHSAFPSLRNTSREVSEGVFCFDYQGNSFSHSLLPSLGNSSRDLSQRFFSSNHQRSSYPRHQRNGPHTTLQENTSNRNHGNLLYVRPQESSSSSMAKEHSQVFRSPEDLLKIQQQQPKNIIGVSMTRLPFLEVIASLLEVLLHPNGPNGTHKLRFFIQEHVLKHFKHKTNDSHQGCNTIPKGPAAPIEITSKCEFHRNHNIIDVRSCEQLVMFVQVARRLTHEDLLQKLLARSPIPPTVTMAKIKEKLQEDKANGGDITMTSLHFALLCPLSKARMKFPCRALTCEHLQCFDAAWYLKMNEKKPKWVCPVCGDPVEYENLLIDEHFKSILEENISSDKILLQADGSWKPFLLQDLSENILTLDDTLESSGLAANNADNVTVDNIRVAHHTTIDLVSEDEASLFDDAYANFESETTDWEPRTDSQHDRAVDVVVLSDDDSFGSPARRALQQWPSQSSQKPFEQQQATSTPNNRLSLNTSKEDGRKAPTPISTGKKATKGRPPSRMVLRSHTRMMKLTSPLKTLLLPELDC